MYRKAGMPLGFAAILLLAGMLTACEEQASEGQARGGQARGEQAGEEEVGSAPAGVAPAGGAPAGGAPAGGAPSIAADTTPSPITSPDLSDANILALLDHAHEADSSAGALAFKTATSEPVKEFARTMTVDHHRLRRQGADLARKLKVVSQPPPDDPITPLAHGEMDALEAAEQGPDFDLTYLQEEIEVHDLVLDLMGETHEAAGNAELKALIQQARPVIESHLRQVRAIEQELGGSPVTAVTPPGADSP